MYKIIRLGARPSALAVKQAREIQAMVSSASFEIVAIETRGDQDKLAPFSQIEGSDFFTREIESALLKGKIDAAVHSAKDLEENMPPELTIAAATASISPFECLVSRGNRRLDELSPGARIGTSSRKRQEALLEYRSDLVICDLRGTIEERLSRLDEGRFDAIIMAHAALIRLGLTRRIAQIIPKEVIAPHPLQGSLAVQVRSADKDLIKLFAAIDKRRGGRDEDQTKR